MIRIPRTEVLNWFHRTAAELNLSAAERDALQELFRTASVTQTGTYEPMSPLEGPDSGRPDEECPACPVGAAFECPYQQPWRVHTFAVRFDVWVWAQARARGETHHAFGLVELV